MKFVFIMKFFVPLAEGLQALLLGNLRHCAILAKEDFAEISSEKQKKRKKSAVDGSGRRLPVK